MARYRSVVDTIGNTPLIALDRVKASVGFEGRIWAKVEYFNPSGSVKDRAALAMIDAAERDGRLQPGGLIVEPTSGNTGVGLAMVAAAKGYRLILTMPDSMSVERRKLLAAYGAELVLTPGSKGMTGAIEEASRIAQERGAFMPMQFDNPANANAHALTTAQEILADLPNLAAFVAGVGTGGTITGVGRTLKEKASNAKIIAVEPDASAVLSGGKAGPHTLMGIGAGFVPKLLDVSVIDEIVRVKGQDAFETARLLVRTEGLLCGITSGAALYAGMQIAARPEYADRDIVVLLPDTGERYLSTALFGED